MLSGSHEIIAARSEPVAILDYSSTLDLNPVGKDGRTPLMLASFMGSIETISLLLKNGANPNVTGLRGLSPLHEASSKGHLTVVKNLIAAGSTVDAVSDDGVTPLMCAAAWGHGEVVQYLLANGADKTMKDDIGATAAEIAEDRGECSIARSIIEFQQSSFTELGSSSKEN